MTSSANRSRKHLTPYFGERRMVTIATPDVRAYILKRQTENSVRVRKARTETLPDAPRSELVRRVKARSMVF